MELTKLYPFLVFAISLITVNIWPKTLFFTIPLLIASLRTGYPGSGYLQISLAVLWVVLVAGNSRAQAYASAVIKTPMALKLLLGAVGLGAAGAAFTILYPGKWDVAALTGSAGMGVIAAVFAYYIVLYGICPLLVQKKEEVHTTVHNYYKLYGRRNGGSYVRFAQDPASYRIPFFLFRRFRNKIGVAATYRRFTCALGICFIGKIKVGPECGEASSWENSAQTRQQRRILTVAVALAAAGVLLFLIVFGVAGILPWQAP